MGEKAAINKQHEYAIKSKVAYDGLDFGEVPVSADYGSSNAAVESASAGAEAAAEAASTGAEAAELASAGAEY